MKTLRGATWRGPGTRGAFHGAVALWLVAAAGCTSNRFRVANDPRIDRNAELAVIDARTRQVPAAPGGLPVAPALVAAADPAPDVDAALNQDQPAPIAPRVPAATYPPRAVPAPFTESDPDAALVENARSPEAGINARPRTEETPRPGPPGTLFAPVVDGPQIAGRVVNAYGRPEPSASIQVYDLEQNRRLVAETASGPDGRFRAQNLEPGRRYEIAAAATGIGNRFFGSATAAPPDGSVVIRLEPEHRNRNGSTYGALDGLPGGKALQGLVARPTVNPVPTSDNVRISAPRLVAAGRVASSGDEGELTNAVAEERVPPRSEPAVLPPAGERPVRRASPVPPPREPTYHPPHDSGAIAGKLGFPIIYKDGTPGTLEQIPGDLILVDFWGTWCGPCKRAVPHLNDLYRKYSNRGLHIVGAAAEHGTRGEQLQRLNSAVSSLRIQYTAVLCPVGLGEPCPLRSAFNVSSFPTFVLIDRGGRVLFTGQGANEETLGRLEQAIRSYLASVGR